MCQLEEKNASPDLDVLIQVDKLQLLYQQSYPAIYVSTFAAIILIAMLWPVQDHTALLIWLAVLIITALSRIYLFTRYRYVAPQGQDVLAWEKPYFITLTLTALAWGVGSLLIMPVGSKVHQAIIYCVLIGFCGGAVSYYSAHRVMTLVTIAIILFPSTLWFLLSGDQLMVGLAILAIVFFLSAVRATKGISSAVHQNYMMTHELKISKENAEKLARIDELTKLYNRRAFYENGKMLVSYCQRHNEIISVIVMDLDNFKNINDSFGHAAGDAVLEHISKLLRQKFRKSDISARIGGEEFGILLPTANPETSEKLAEELRQEIEESSIVFNEDNIKVTASIGVTSGDSDIDTLVKHADIAMYRAKESGRNNVVCYKSGAMRSAQSK
jgi:diguanylate cyclase (GGDEF)-like protein